MKSVGHVIPTFTERGRATVARLRAIPRTPTQWAYVMLWLVYLVGYPIAVIGVAFDVRPGFAMAWAGSFLLFLQGTLAVVWLGLALGWRRGGLLAGLIALGGFVGETVGANTGFPFGRYTYADVLVPRLPGSVPLPVIGAWLLVVVTAVAWARRIIPATPPHQQRSAFWQRLAVAVALGVALDLVLEPVAVHIEHYWAWHASGPYYGIPTANFAGWAVLCALLTALLSAAWSTRAPSQEARSLPVAQRSAAPVWRVPDLMASATWLYSLTMLMFALIDLTHGLWLAAGIGGSTLAFLAVRSHATYDAGEKHSHKQ